MKYEAHESLRGAVIATPEIEQGYLGAYEYPQGASDLEDARRIMLIGSKVNILQVMGPDVKEVNEGNFSVMEKYIGPISGQVGAYIVHTTCHLFPVGRDMVQNVYKLLYEFAPYSRSKLDMRLVGPMGSDMYDK